MSTAPFTFFKGNAPLLISIPHVGTTIPADIAAGMTDEALRTPDTDWHLDRLYAFAKELGASVLYATHSRYVVDLNRPPDNANLYPGQNTTGLCPIDTFDSQPLYRDGIAPDAIEIERRRTQYWQPYHDQLASELKRLRSESQQVVLWDAHSIRSVVPRFFEGTLPALNFGTVDGASCSNALSDIVMQCAAQDARYSQVLNGRFKGGYITRKYGAPAKGVHAIQLEMAQNTYMLESFPYEFDEKPAAQIEPLLRQIIKKTITFAQG
jgi:N-formylglutamate deformylase